MATTQKRATEALKPSTQAAVAAAREARANGTSVTRALFLAKTPKAQAAFLRSHL